MAFPVIRAVSSGVGGLMVPALNQGETVILIRELFDGSGSKDLVVGTVGGKSWTSLGSVAGTSDETSYLSAAYLINANATESATSISVTTVGDWGLGTCAILVISGAHTSTPPEGSFTTGQNPPSLNPVNWGNEDTLWITAAARYFSAPTGSPTNYTTASTENFMRTAYRALNTGSEDPGTFSGGSGNGSVATIAVRPAPPPLNTPRSMHYAMQGVR